MKIMLVAGARPNFVKVASLSDAIHARNRATNSPIDSLLIHTGQHYDEQMSRTFFTELSLPQPDVSLEVGSSSHTRQTAEMVDLERAASVSKKTTNPEVMVQFREWLLLSKPQTSVILRPQAEESHVTADA